MAWSTPRTWNAGETVTATIMNAHIRDNFNAIARAVRTFAQNAAVIAGNGAGAETVALTAPLGAGDMGTNGNNLLITFSGQTAVNGNTKKLRAYLGASVSIIFSITSSGVLFFGQIMIARTASSAQTVFWWYTLGSNTSVTSGAAWTADLTVSNTFKLTCEGTLANDIVLQPTQVSLCP